jgi:hypothetical protein
LLRRRSSAYLTPRKKGHFPPDSNPKGPQQSSPRDVFEFYYLTALSLL